MLGTFRRRAGLSVPGDSLGQNIADIPGTAGPRAQGGAGWAHPLQLPQGPPRAGWVSRPQSGRVTSPPGLCGAALSPGSVPAFWGHTQSFSQPPRWEEVPSGRCPFSRKVKSEITSNRCLCRLQKLSSMESPKPQASEAARPASPTPSAPSPASHLQESERLRGAVRSLQDERSALHAQLQERE